MTCMYAYFGGRGFFGFGDLFLFYSSLLLIMMQFYMFASCLMHAHY